MLLYHDIIILTNNQIKFCVLPLAVITSQYYIEDCEYHLEDDQHILTAGHSSWSGKLLDRVPHVCISCQMSPLLHRYWKVCLKLYKISLLNDELHWLSTWLLLAHHPSNWGRPLFLRLKRARLLILTIRSPGGDLRQVCAAVRGPGAAADWAELPSHRNPQGHEPGGEAVQVVFFY